MKKTMLKLISAVLLLGMVCALLTGCGSSKTLMTMTIDGKTYSVSTAEYELLLKIRKLDIACNNMITRDYDTASIWNVEYTGDDADFEGQTVDQYYTNAILRQAKAILVEKYLFDLNGLEISKDKLDSYASAEKSTVQSYGGKGTYKQYWGYTAADYYDLYMTAVSRSEILSDYLYNDETGTQKLTAEELEQNYQENYAGYQFIMIDTTAAVVLDEEGNRVLAKTTDDDGNEIDDTAYETTEFGDEDEEKKTEKQNLPQIILNELAEGASFEDMVQKYSDEYYSVEFPEGLFVRTDATFIDDDVQAAIKDLAIGEYTTEAIGVDNNETYYIVKRVALKEKAYEDEKYADEFFSTYTDDLKTEKYEDYVETFFDKITVDETLASGYTMADTYLSKYADYYYQQYLQSLLSGYSS